MASPDFLHGRRTGNNLNLVKKHGPPKIVENKNLPFIIASPQCPGTDLWWKPDVVAGLVDELLGKYPVDPDKVYLTGLSQEVSARRHGRSAPRKVCRRRTGLRRREKPNGRKFGPSQFGTFMGMPTKSYSVGLSRIMVEAVEKAGGRIKYTEYPESGTILGLKPTETPNCTIGCSPTRETKSRDPSGRKAFQGSASSDT